MPQFEMQTLGPNPVELTSLSDERARDITSKRAKPRLFRSHKRFEVLHLSAVANDIGQNTGMIRV